MLGLLPESRISESPLPSAVAEYYGPAGWACCKVAYPQSVTIVCIEGRPPARGDAAARLDRHPV